VYSWGYGAEGRLGHGDTQDQTQPKLIKALLKEKIVTIAANGGQSFAITGKNFVLMLDGSSDFHKISKLAFAN
jgi:E3 ubiquitin-protein ligase HERC2